MPLEDKNIDEQMAADWAGIREKFKEELPAPEVQEPEAPETPEPTQETAEDAGRPRNEDGTFAPKPKESAKPPASEPKNVASNEPVATEPVISPKGTPLDLTRAPNSWKPAARAEFAKLPEAIRAEIHRRENDAAAGVQQLLPDAQLGKSMREVVAPYKALIDAEAGGKPEVAFAELMKTAAILRMGTPEQKRNVVLGVARQYGVDLSLPAQTAQPGQPAQPQVFQDPRVDQLLQHLQTQEQQRQQAEQSQLESTVTQWMEAKDEKGQPKYPYLSDVMDLMQVFVPHLRQTNPSLSHEQVLQRAYEQATWANPDVRPLIQPPTTPANPERVREAKRAASVNVPRRASQPSPATPGKMDDTIAETARALGFIS